MFRIAMVTLFLNLFLYANVGKITVLTGNVTVKRADQTLQGKSGMVLEKNDLISTDKNGKVQIVFIDNTIFTIGKDSTLDIADYLYDESQPKKNTAKFNVLKGAFSSITGNIGKLNKSKFQLKTKSASIGIRGTIVIANQESVLCTEGAISVTALDGTTVRVDAGYKTDVSSGTPTPPEPIQEGDVESVDVTVANDIATTDATQEEPTTTQNTQNVATTVNEDAAADATTQAINDNVDEVVQKELRSVTLTGRAINSTGAQQLVNIDAENIENSVDLSSQGMTTETDTASIGNSEAITWGHWDSDPTKKFVVGTQTDVQILDDIRNATTTTSASYNGQVTGTVNGSDAIKVDSTNQVQVNFELGGGQNTMDGSIGFKTQSGQTWDSSFSGSTSGNSFSATSISGGTNGQKNLTSGAVDGNFYGTDAQAVGGTFQLSTDQDTATGVFKATK